MEMLAPEVPENTSEQQSDAKALFQKAYKVVACKVGDFDSALSILRPVQTSDEGVLFEEKALPGMLLLPSDGPSKYTMLHQAAWHGNERAVRSLLRLGANAEQPNAQGESAAHVASAQGHEQVARMLHSHAQAWSGWGVVELSCLECLYHEDRFVDGDAYLHRLVERDHAKHAGGPGSLFRRPLPSNICMLDIAAVMSTSGTGILREAFPDYAFPDYAVADEEEEDDEACADQGEWPDDNWVAPQPGYMVCALCKGKSGAAGRWGTKPHPSLFRYPLSVCWLCKRLHGLAPKAGEDERRDDQELPSEVWADDTLALLARTGYWDSRIVQLVHPVFGDIGH